MGISVLPTLRSNLETGKHASIAECTIVHNVMAGALFSQDNMVVAAQAQAWGHHRQKVDEPPPKKKTHMLVQENMARRPSEELTMLRVHAIHLGRGFTIEWFATLMAAEPRSTCSMIWLAFIPCARTIFRALSPGRAAQRCHAHAAREASGTMAQGPSPPP